MRKNKKGFTLLELLTVIIIVGILGALALPNYMKTQRRSYAAEAWANTAAIMDAIKTYYMEHNSTWPANITVLPMDNPNSKPNRKFLYSISQGVGELGGTYMYAWADGVGIAGSGNMVYYIQCATCMESTEKITRFECTDALNCYEVGG